MSDAGFEIVDAFAELLADTRAYLEAESARGQRYLQPSSSVKAQDSVRAAVVPADQPAPQHAGNPGVSSFACSRMVQPGHVWWWLESPWLGHPRPERTSGPMLQPTCSKRCSKMFWGSRLMTFSCSRCSQNQTGMLLLSSKASGKGSWLFGGKDKGLGRKVVLVMGQVGVDAVLGEGVKIDAIRGHWQEHGSAALMATFHPEYLIRNPEAKRAVFQDLKAVNAALISPKKRQATDAVDARFLWRFTHPVQMQIRS